MIVLDTNVLMEGVPGPSTLATLVRGLAIETGHPLAIPEEVLDEFLANKERAIRPLLDDHDMPRLLSQVPQWLDRAAAARGEAGAPLPTIKSVSTTFRTTLTTNFSVLPTPPRARDEAHARERDRRPPASGGGNEGRDVVVWLTALQAALDAKPSNVYFVSRDKTFRGESDGRLRAELRGEAPANLKFCADLDALFDTLSCPATASEGLAESREVLSVVEQTAQYGGHNPNHDLRRDLWDWTGSGPSATSLTSVLASVDASTQSVATAARRVGSVTLTAIDAVFRLEVQHALREFRPFAVTSRLGVLAIHDRGDFVSARVLARGGLRLSARADDQETTNGTE